MKKRNIIMVAARMVLWLSWLGMSHCSRSTTTTSSSGTSSGTSTSSTSSSVSPVRQYESSWAASQASATAIATRFQTSMLLVLVSPASTVYRPLPVTTTASSSPSNDPIQNLFGMRVSRINSDDNINHNDENNNNNDEIVQFAPPWIRLGPHSLCAMTGLASDVEHLIRLIQHQVDTHWNVYDAHMTTHAMTVGLATALATECLHGNRPFGVQCLLLGGDGRDDSDDDVSDPHRLFGVYTMDPSGAWQSWGGTTAIGKYAPQLQVQLAKQRTTLKPPTTLVQALERVVDCWIETTNPTVPIRVEDHDNDYQVLILHKMAGDPTCHVYAVCDDDVRRIVSERVQAAATNKIQSNS